MTLTTGPSTTPASADPPLPEQLPVLLSQIAEYVGHRTITIGSHAQWCERGPGDPTPTDCSQRHSLTGPSPQPGSLPVTEETGSSGCAPACWAPRAGAEVCRPLARSGGLGRVAGVAAGIVRC
jgi:hypothetical protein